MCAAISGNNSKEVLAYLNMTTSLFSPVLRGYVYCLVPLLRALNLFGFVT